MALQDEKTVSEFAERLSQDSKTAQNDGGFSSDDLETVLDKHETRRILRKVDYRLIPFLSLLYLCVRLPL